MNWLDLVFAVLVVICGIAGLRVGLIRAAGGALGVVLGILIASQVSGDLGRLYAGYLANEPLTHMLPCCAQPTTRAPASDRAFLRHGTSTPGTVCACSRAAC